MLPSSNTSLHVEPVPIADSKWQNLKDMVVSSLPSANSKRLYAQALDAFYRWYFAEQRLPFSKAVVQEYRAFLERRGYAPSTTALNLSALRKLATEAADNGLLDPQLATGICRIGGVGTAKQPLPPKKDRNLVASCRKRPSQFRQPAGVK